MNAKSPLTESCPTHLPANDVLQFAFLEGGVQHAAVFGRHLDVVRPDLQVQGLPRCSAASQPYVHMVTMVTLHHTDW